MLHGLFLAAPTGVLLLIVWELFDEHPDHIKVWSMIVVLAVMLVVQLWVAGKVMVKSNNTILTMTSKLRLMLGDHLHRLSLGFYKRRDPGDLASVVLQDVGNFEAIFREHFQNMVGAVFGTLFLSIFLFLMDRQLAFVMIAAIPCAFLIMLVCTKIAKKYSLKHVAARNETGSRFIEYILGVQYLEGLQFDGQSLLHP